MELQKISINAHLKKLLKGNSKKDTKYADPVPIKKVNINTLNNKVNELNIYSIKKVSFKT